MDWAALANSAANIVTSAVGASATANLNKKNRAWQEQQSGVQRDWSEQMMNNQNAWNYEMWQKEQEYNTPENQVARLRAAGLNPLFYGLDGNTTGQAQVAAQPLGYERASQFAVGNPVESAFDSAVKVAQVSNIQADTAKKGEETLTEIQRREKIMADIDKTRQDINNLIETEALTKVERAKLEKDLEWLDKINAATVGAKEADKNLSEANKRRIEELLPGEKELQNMSVEDFEHKWKKIDSEIAKMAEETGLLREDIENYALNHASNGVFGSGLSVQNIGRGLKSISNAVKKRTRRSDFVGQSVLSEDLR